MLIKPKPSLRNVKTTFDINLPIVLVRSQTVEKCIMVIRAGELPKKFRPWVQTRHMGLKNVPKKFGTPGPNLAPNLFGLFVQGQITKAGTPKWTHRTQWIWIYVKIIYDFLNFSLFTPPLLNKFLTLLVNWTSKTRLQG